MDIKHLVPFSTKHPISRLESCVANQPGLVNSALESKHHFVCYRDTVFALEARNDRINSEKVGLVGAKQAADVLERITYFFALKLTQTSC